MGFPGGSAGKESACNAGDLGSISGLGRSPGGGHGNPLQYSCLVLRRADALTDGIVYLTVEPHLHIFQAYQKIDSHKLKTGIEFDNSDDAFDCAVTKLKETLTSLGFHEEENKIWK